jgi:hypothetical protein
MAVLPRSDIRNELKPDAQRQREPAIIGRHGDCRIHRRTCHVADHTLDFVHGTHDGGHAGQHAGLQLDGHHQ